ncbi:hypothetical protein AGRA3207_005282 [Actinomadura graeca]|uniref:DUF2637 domain-containing protein n=1 Tax=Actinomadura graeca TaxID=2750812 RepID=A0ABX8QZ38_9ACTN|nr:hypothetical protein [Actinomadura graeca]QXJ24035.1 hypothetical protein AGRA3207_005282 [Actinomadura graeca]
MPSDPTRPGAPRYSPVQRRLLTATAGLVVAALAGGAYALTFDLLRDLAVAGRVSRRWAPVYPAMADTLTAMTILSLVITRHARWWTRLLRWTLLVVLVAGVAAISVQHSLRGFQALPGDALRVGVAVAPHAMLVTAVWLWLTMFKQIRTARPAADEPEPQETQRGHVKVLGPRQPEIEAPRPELEAAPRHEDPEASRETPAPRSEEPYRDEPEIRPELDSLPGPLAIAPPPRLPTDVELVRSREQDDSPGKEHMPAATTRPDLVMPPAPGARGSASGAQDTVPDADDIPSGGEGDEYDAPPTDRPEDADAEEEGRGRHRRAPAPAPIPDQDQDQDPAPEADPETDAGPRPRDSGEFPIFDWNPPPSGSFRSSPLPPAE